MPGHHRLSPYARERQRAALADPAIADHVSPEEIGISADFKCIIW